MSLNLSHFLSPPFTSPLSPYVFSISFYLLPADDGFIEITYPGEVIFFLQENTQSTSKPRPDITLYEHALHELILLHACLHENSNVFYFPGGLSNPAYVRDLYDTGDDGGDDAFEAEPTATEKTLPWLRKDDEDQAICQVNI